MTEWEKMVAGRLYDPAHPELAAARRRARGLTRALNDTRDDEVEKRAALLRELLGAAGERVWIEPPFHCDYGTNLAVGSDVFFNFGCVVLDVAPVRVGDRVLVGPGVQLLAATHPLGAAERRTGLELGSPVEIGSDVWIGGGAIVCPGVRVGARSVIGAGSVVTRDVPEGVLAAGNPCRVVREIAD